MSILSFVWAAKCVGIYTVWDNIHCLSIIFLFYLKRGPDHFLSLMIWAVIILVVP